MVWLLLERQALRKIWMKLFLVKISCHLSRFSKIIVAKAKMAPIFLRIQHQTMMTPAQFLVAIQWIWVKIGKTRRASLSFTMQWKTSGILRFQIRTICHQKQVDSKVPAIHSAKKGLIMPACSSLIHKRINLPNSKWQLVAQCLVRYKASQISTIPEPQLIKTIKSKF